MKMKIEQPLKHRPNVLVMTDPDGKRFVRGDGNPFGQADLAALGTVTAPENNRPPLTADEKAEIEAAEQRLAEALALVDRAHARMDTARNQAQRYEASLGRIGEAEAKRMKQLRREHEEAKSAWEEVRELEGQARRELTHAQQRAHGAARMRTLAAEAAGKPPAKDDRPLSERLGDVAARLR